MSLIALRDFWDKKSIKLSDAFEVLIQYEEGGEFISLPTCCSFTVPKIEYEEETLSYGNIEQVFLTPKYDSCKELTLEFFETYLTENDIFNSSVTLSRIFKYIDLSVNQKYIGVLKQTNYADYQKHMINSIVVKIMDNKLQNYVYQYVFGNLKVVNYTIYNLDYQSDNSCKVSVTLSFETYEKGSIKEEINYGVTETQDTPPVNDKRDTVEETIENKIESVNPPESTTTNDSGENTDPFENLENTINQQESDYNSLLELENMEDLNVSTDGSTQNPAPSPQTSEQTDTSTNATQDPAPSQPPSNVEESQDELGNRKVENETGTLYKTIGGKTYYEDKESGKVYDVDNVFQESKAHEGLVSETRNGDTQYYTSMIDKGEEIYRGKNVTTEVKPQMKPEDWAKSAAKEDIKYGTKKGDRGNNFAIGLTQIDQTEEAYDAYTDAYDAYIDKNAAAPEKKKVPVKTKKVTIGELSKELDTSKLSFGNKMIVKAAIAMNKNTEIEVPVDRKTKEKTYFGFTAKEIAKQVAKYDKENNTKESTAYSIAYQYMDEGDKNTFKTSYQNELNK